MMRAVLSPMSQQGQVALDPAGTAAARPVLVQVRMLKNAASRDGWAGYAPGDLAGFAPDVANRLVKEGLATFDLADMSGSAPA